MSTASTAANAFAGINIANGNVDCGTVTGNLIGSTTTLAKIAFSTSAQLGGFIGIRTGAGGTLNIANNIISMWLSQLH